MDLRNQCVLQCFLQGTVHRQHQRGPGYGLPQLRGAAHGPVKPGVDAHPPILPAQQVVVGGFQPALADDGIHGQAPRFGGGPLRGGDRAGQAQRVGQQRTTRPAAHAPGGGPHRAALHKARRVEGGQHISIRAPGHGQLPRRGGRTKGSKLCFHILAACQGLYVFYSLTQVGPRRGRDAQV